MLVRSQVKYIQNLGHKKFRDADGVFVAEGPKIVNELLYSDHLELVQCFATESWMMSHDEIVKEKKELFFKTDEKELQRISFHSSPNEVLAVFTKPVFNQLKKPVGLTLLLETIQDPGNLGTIIRTADWFGLKQIICSVDTVDVFNPKVVQSAMGSVIRVEMIYTDLTEYIRENQEIPLYASTLDGEDINQKLSLSNALLLMGNESRGISLTLESMAVKKIRIPRMGSAESLNVAVATGILLSHIRMIS
jgi:RNA methyltransferase, TrmH family